ncbi:MAG: VacJ family lipoprotein [Gammaproteobacteria bacterium]|nr:VacJ family lipoprotein [Gammaproteobacteria bacterium]
MKTTTWMSFFLGLVLSSAALAAADEPAAPNNRDPYETFNRHTYKLNDTLDRAILKPIAEGYVFIMPNVGQKGVHNFLTNLKQLPYFINDVLQFDGYAALSDTWRFLINTTIGIAGFIDVATPLGLPAHTQDVGLTFARWGYKQSNYLVIPFWGPSTVRDALGLLPYYFMTVYPYIDPPELGWALLGVDVIDQRAQFLKLDDVAKKAALDPYAFQRNAYLQRRNALISDNEGTAGKDTAFEEEEDEDIDADFDDDEKPAAPDTTKKKGSVNKSTKTEAASTPHTTPPQPY